MACADESFTLFIEAGRRTLTWRRLAVQPIVYYEQTICTLKLYLISCFLKLVVLMHCIFGLHPPPFRMSATYVIDYKLN